MPTPRYDPTDEQRERVKTLAGIGMSDERIAAYIRNPNNEKPISERTLRNKFRSELSDGRIVAGARVLQTAFNMAVGMREIQEVQPDGTILITQRETRPDRVMNIWYQKTQLKIIEPEVEARIAIAKRMAELRGLLDDDRDPHETARAIRAFLDDMETLSAPRQLAKD